MKKKIIISISLLGLILWVSCGQDNTQTSSKKPSQKTAQKTSSKQTNTTNNDDRASKEWPFVDENQQNEEIAENLLTKNFILIFDGSGSMDKSKCSDGKAKIQVAKEAVIEWSKTLNLDINLGLVAFHNFGWVERPVAKGERTDFINSIQNITAGDTTPLTEAFKKAYIKLSKQGRHQLGYGEYTIIVVTDGIANKPDLLSKKVIEILGQSPINIHTIGFCIDQQHSLNQPGSIIYKSANNPEALRQGLQEVLAESESFDESEFNQ